jgi:hypothetical protein
MDFRKESVKIGNNTYTIIACSVMGVGKIENQDSYGIYYDENQLIVAVADGLGSAVYSKEGSSLIVKLLIDILKKGVEDSKLPSELLQQWKIAVNGKLNFYDTTIKFIWIKNGLFNYGGVGDGWIAINTNKDLISLSSSNTFSNQTDSILSFDLTSKFINRKIDEKQVLNALISTDGFSEDIEKENGKAFMDEIHDQNNKDAVSFEKDIYNTLENWPIKSNVDDKTVVFIQREEF